LLVLPAVPTRFTTVREIVMSHESIPLILYALGVALLLAVAWVDWADRANEMSAASRSP